MGSATGAWSLTAARLWGANAAQPASRNAAGTPALTAEQRGGLTPHAAGNETEPRGTEVSLCERAKPRQEVDFRIKLKNQSLFQSNRSLFSFFSRQFILINLLNNKNTSEENYVHFIQFVLTICFETIN